MLGKCAVPFIRNKEHHVAELLDGQQFCRTVRACYRSMILNVKKVNTTWGKRVVNRVGL